MEMWFERILKAVNVIKYELRIRTIVYSLFSVDLVLITNHGVSNGTGKITCCWTQAQTHDGDQQ